MLIFYLHCNLFLRISGITIICYIKTHTNVKFPLYLKKAGLASRNIVHLQKIILRCVGLACVAGGISRASAFVLVAKP